MRVSLGIFVLALAACSGGRRAGRDVAERPGDVAVAEASNARSTASTTTVRSVATPSPAGVKPQVLARANAPAIATTKTHVYFSDAEDDVLLALPKNVDTSASLPAPARIARRAPVSGALVADDVSLTWIAVPGDVVFRLPIEDGATPAVLREREIFTDVAAHRGDVFLVGAASGGGALTRITGHTAARIASFDAVPRTVLVDETNVFVVTPKSVLRTPRTRGEVVTLATGAAFGAATSDEGSVYVTTKQDASRAILRVPKYGGATAVTARITGVRDAPIAVRAGEVFFFDETRPALRAHMIDTNTTRTVSEDPMFERVNALVIDGDTAFVATGEGSSSALLRISLR